MPPTQVKPDMEVLDITYWPRSPSLAKATSDVSWWPVTPLVWLIVVSGYFAYAMLHDDENDDDNAAAETERGQQAVKTRSHKKAQTAGSLRSRPPDLDAPYCIASVYEPVESDYEEAEMELVTIELADFDSVLIYLAGVYKRFSVEQPAELFDAHTVLGGFGVVLTNRFGSQVKVGVGDVAWLLIRIDPQPTILHRVGVPAKTSFVFYLDGWHWTEMKPSDLVLRERCQEDLRAWIEHDVFPE